MERNSSNRGSVIPLDRVIWPNVLPTRCKSWHSNTIDCNKLDMTHKNEECEEDWRNEYKAIEQSWMYLKDQYAEVARALGFEGDAWFGDPLADHAEIVAKARTINQQLQKAREEMRQETMRKVMEKMRKLVDDPDENIYLEEIEEALYELDQSELDQDNK